MTQMKFMEAVERLEVPGITRLRKMNGRIFLAYDTSAVG